MTNPDTTLELDHSRNHSRGSSFGRNVETRQANFQNQLNELKNVQKGFKTWLSELQQILYQEKRRTFDHLGKIEGSVKISAESKMESVKSQVAAQINEQNRKIKVKISDLKQSINLLVQKVQSIDLQTKDILPVLFQKD